MVKEVLTEKEITKRFQVVFDYLSGEQIAQVKTTLANHSYTKQAFKAVKLSLPDDNPFHPIDPKIDAIFQILNIQNEALKKKLIHDAKDLYTLLLKLRAEENIYHLKRLIALIDKTRPKPLLSWWTKTVLFLGGLLVGSSIFDFVDPKRFKTVMAFIGKGYTLFKETLKSVFQVAKNFALLAMGIHTLSLLFKLVGLYRTQSKSKKTKMTSALFALITSGLSISAYGLTFLAFGVATPIASGLMVTANFMAFLKAGYRLRQHEKAFMKGPKPNDPKDRSLHFGERAAYQRSVFDIKQHRLTLKTKMAMAILSTIVVAVWCFCPPSLLLTAFSIGTLLILGALQSTLIKAFKAQCQNQLQRALDDLPDPFDEVSPKLALLNKHQSEKVTVTQRENGVELQHQQLRLLLPEGSEIQDRRDQYGPYKAVFFGTTPTYREETQSPLTPKEEDTFAQVQIN